MSQIFPLALSASELAAVRYVSEQQRKLDSLKLQIAEDIRRSHNQLPGTLFVKDMETGLAEWTVDPVQQDREDT